MKTITSVLRAAGLAILAVSFSVVVAVVLVMAVLNASGH